MKLIKRAGFTIIPENWNQGRGDDSRFFRPPEGEQKKPRRKKKRWKRLS